MPTHVGDAETPTLDLWFSCRTLVRRWRRANVCLGIKKRLGHRTLADGWTFRCHYTTESACRIALPTWLHFNIQRRPGIAIGTLAPFTRLDNLTGRYK